MTNGKTAQIYITSCHISPLTSRTKKSRLMGIEICNDNATQKERKRRNAKFPDWWVFAWHLEVGNGGKMWFVSPMSTNILKLLNGGLSVMSLVITICCGCVIIIP